MEVSQERPKKVVYRFSGFKHSGHFGDYLHFYIQQKESGLAASILEILVQIMGFPKNQRFCGVEIRDLNQLRKASI